MPSIASHFVVANKVAIILNINSDDFMLGNILPDIIDDNNSHLKIKGKYYQIPNIQEFINTAKYKDYIFLGYLTHLLLDKIFLEDYIPKNIKNYNKINLFSANMIYNDYTNMNKYLVEKYNLDLNYINKIMSTNKYKFIEDKYILNVDSINNLNGGSIKYINLNTFYNFLDESAVYVAKYIKRWII